MTVARWSALAVVLGGCVAAPDEPAADAVAAGGELQAVYVVDEGDTLAAIAHRFAVRGGWRALAAANHLVDADHVEAYQGLIIPTEGMIANGNDPFSLYDDLDLIPRRPPIVLDVTPREPAYGDDLEYQRGADTRDGCGGRHQHLELEPSALDDPEQVHCVSIARREVCVTEAEPERCCGDDDGDAVAVTVDGAPWLRLAYSFLEPLELVEVDLDGDGQDELVMADLESVSNGAAIATYAMVVAAGPGAPPHRYSTSGWSFVRDERGCAIEHGSFEEIDDPLDGDGNYDVTRDLIWRDGVLATRGDGIRADRWSSQPPQLRGEPLLEGQVLSRRTGIVVAFDDSLGGQRALTLAIGAERVVLGQRTWSWSDDESDPDPETQYAGLGWAGEPVLLPDDYRPPAAALLGRTATIETRLDFPRGDLTQVVWLDPARR